MPGNLLDTGYPCLRCRRRPPCFDRARAWGLYQGNLRELLRQYKFQGHPRLAAPLAERLAEAFARYFQTESFDLVTPVPLHVRRERERGFDQTRLLAERLSRRLGIPLGGKVIRVKRTEPQFGLDLKARRHNLAGAFQVREPESFRRRNVLIVDDIMTTGTTVQELGATLRKSAEVRRIGVLTVARVSRFV